MTCCGADVNLIPSELDVPPDDREEAKLVACPVCEASVVIDIRGATIMVVPVKRAGTP